MAKKNIITLFITDDDVDDREFLTAALLQNGFREIIKEFKNGEELMNHLTANPASPADLIILDLNMPVKNGYQALKELKENDDFRNIPVIILTSSSKLEDEQYCYNLGCSNFFRKPLSFTGYIRLAEDIISFTKKIQN